MKLKKKILPRVIPLIHLIAAFCLSITPLANELDPHKNIP